MDLGHTIRGLAAGQKHFGRYTLERLLGRGGMGVVWLARDEELERQVALKFLPEELALDVEVLRDFKKETRRCLDLRYHHIVGGYDFLHDQRHAPFRWSLSMGIPSQE